MLQTIQRGKVVAGLRLNWAVFNDEEGPLFLLTGKSLASVDQREETWIVRADGKGSTRRRNVWRCCSGKLMALASTATQSYPQLWNSNDLKDALAPSQMFVQSINQELMQGMAGVSRQALYPIGGESQSVGIAPLA